ncbi:BREX-1 system adenine-specific DNA-methyltransferase PglX [Gracilibacillus sp. Marseille-QA3620]
MDKSALKTFATNARKELLKKVEAKAMKIGITEETIKKADIESSDAFFIDGRQLSKQEKTQRDELIARISQIGFKQVMEEVAYTWFNRFTALRFMEVNDYLPTGVRVLSSSNPNSADPDILNEALELDLEVELDKEHIYNLKLNNETEELFKYLIIKHCNDMNRFLPFMFETIDDFTEILFPEGLLTKDSFIRQMTDIEFIPEYNWQKVEVIGWLYQYYIAEEKDRVIKAKKKYKTEEIPYATQLFTPDWIVRYMVQNSLGRYWVESHTEHRDLIGNWEFYLENSNPEPDFEEKLAPYINKELKVEDIKCFDPAMGSGHILVYMFDVLYEIYSKCGYIDREIPRLIIQNNLYGLDIDDRAFQLASFSVVMKALEYNSRFLRSIEREGLSLNLAAIQETNSLNNDDIAYVAGESSGKCYEKVEEFVSQFIDGKSIGSLLIVADYEWDYLKKRLAQIQESPASDLFEEEIRSRVLSILPNLLKQIEIMTQNYDILVTNPPYMGNRYMSAELSKYIGENYPTTKSDLFSAFMQYCIGKVKKSGQLGFITPYVWMFISSYEDIRKEIVKNCDISTLIQLEYNSFEVAVVPVCTFTLRNYYSNTSGEYIRLSDFKGISAQPLKTLEAVTDPNVDFRYTAKTANFLSIPGMPIAYWIDQRILDIFVSSENLSSVSSAKQGLATGDNNRFLRVWHEVAIDKIGFDIGSRELARESGIKWFPYNKGGGYHKWYGKNEYIINWENDGDEIRNNYGENGKLKSRPQNTDFYFKEAISWGKVTNISISLRYIPQGFIFDVAGCSIFTDQNLYVLLGTLNSRLINEMLKFMSPTMNYEVGQISNLPIIFQGNEEEIGKIAFDCVEIAKTDWDSYERSWDFKKHPFINYSTDSGKIAVAFEKWKGFTEQQFRLLKENERSLNRIFINKFQLNDILSPDISDEEITIKKAEIVRDIRSFISYAIGCIFGRYSLDEEGLVYAGGKFNPNKYQTLHPVQDNILPLLDGSYFDEDIVSSFIDFVQVTFGEDTLAENLELIADTLSKKKGETAKETIRRYFLNDFFKDHVQTYKKRPIYWLFTSGKQKAFNCLIYMHRYDKTTLSRIRTDYLHEYQIRLDAEKKELLSIIEGDYTTKEISNAKNELKSLDKKIEELKEYDELLHNMADKQIGIDLDDGFTHNYDLFKGLVPKIK